jgi:hypothetical protein
MHLAQPDVPTPSLRVCNNTTPAGNATFGVAHPFVLLLLYPGSPCSQQNKPPLSNISHVPFAQRGCSACASAFSLQPCAPGGQHTTLCCGPGHVKDEGQHAWKPSLPVAPQSTSRPLGHSLRRTAKPGWIREEGEVDMASEGACCEVARSSSSA